jgi:hypothetical protein
MSNTIKAVHDDDLPKLLEKLELLNKFNAGKLNCAFCDDVITKDNLHSIFADSGALKFACSKPACVTALIEKLEKRKYE